MKLIYLIILFFPHTFVSSTNTTIDTSDFDVSVVLDDVEVCGVKVETLQQTVPFEFIVRDGSKRHRKIFGLDGEYRYGDDPSDSGNYNELGQLVGTGLSISAIRYGEYKSRKLGYDYHPTKADMMSISKDEAIEIYSEMYYNKNVSNLKVHDPILVDFIYNTISSCGNSRTFNDVLLELTGTCGSGTTQIEDEDVENFNNFCSNIENEKLFYELFYAKRTRVYDILSKQNGMRGLSRYMRDYDKYQYCQYFY